MPPAHPTHRYLLWLGFLAAVVFVALIMGWSYVSFFTPQLASPTVAEFPQDAPAPTPQDYVQAQKGFQYLVSYTEQGFAPAALSVKQGETVRFTNNSSTSLELSLDGATSAPLIHGTYFEYTFTKTGTFTYSDGTNKGTVTVN